MNHETKVYWIKSVFAVLFFLVAFQVTFHEFIHIMQCTVQPSCVGFSVHLFPSSNSSGLFSPAMSVRPLLLTSSLGYWEDPGVRFSIEAEAYLISFAVSCYCFLAYHGLVRETYLNSERVLNDVEVI